MFGTNLFTYLVGFEKCEFLVHEDVVSKYSPVLKAAMTSPMREKERRIVELTDVDPKTFQDFMSYAYFHASHDCFNNKPEAVSEISRSKIIELLLLYDHQMFSCKSCLGGSELLRCSLTFPRCKSCFNAVPPRINWQSHCVRLACLETADRLEGLLCEPCLESCGVRRQHGGAIDGLEKIQLQCPQSLKTLKRFRFDIPLRAAEIASSMEKSTCGMHLPYTGLVEMVKLAVFAERYHIELLSEATCLALYKTMAMESFNDDSIETTLNVAWAIYEGTPDTGTTLFEEKHVLRRMIAEFIATRLTQFTSQHPMETFFDQQQDLYLDIMTIVASEKPGRC